MIGRVKEQKIPPFVKLIREDTVGIMRVQPFKRGVGALCATYTICLCYSGTATAWAVSRLVFMLPVRGKEFRVPTSRAQPQDAACQSRQSGS